MKDPYIDHPLEVGQQLIARHRQKDREIDAKEFQVNTSKMNTTMNKE
jgi:hypothetical protein